MWESQVSISETISNNFFIKDISIGQFDIGEESFVSVACWAEIVDDDGDLFLQGNGGDEVCGFGAEVHPAVSGVFGLWGVDTEKADAGGAVFCVGDIDVECVAVDYFCDGEGVKMIFSTIGGEGSFIQDGLSEAFCAAVIEPNGTNGEEANRGDYGASLFFAYCVMFFSLFIHFCLKSVGPRNNIRFIAAKRA